MKLGGGCSGIGDETVIDGQPVKERKEMSKRRRAPMAVGGTYGQAGAATLGNLDLRLSASGEVVA